MQVDYLWHKLGKPVQEGLQDKDVFEISLNPDCSLWFHSKASGTHKIGIMPKAQADSFVHAVAYFNQKILNEDFPYLDGSLPFNGERINITIPPITKNISFNIRKHNRKILSLDHYVQQGILQSKQKIILEQAILDNKNILVSGGPASGKTTFTNALLHSMSVLFPSGKRILIMEQVSELQCSMSNVKYMLSTDKASLNSLLYIAMRNTPDKIIIGEVRDGAALTMLKAFNTGCAGGMATIHANSAILAIQRVIDLCCEAVVNPPYSLAAQSIDFIVHLTKINNGVGRKVTELIEVTDYDWQNKKFCFKTY